jgi:hypothetical protein
MAYQSYYRTYPRYPMQYPIIFKWVTCVGEGLLTNLSFSGCSVLCDHTPLVGAEVRVGILLPDQTQALSIESGTIKWVDDRRFGVEFHPLPLDARQRLNRTLRKALIYRLNLHPGQKGCWESYPWL